MQLAKAKDAAKKLGVDILSSDWPYNFLQSQKLKSHPITILCYHTLRPDDDPIDAWTALRIRDFGEQVKILQSDYDIVSLDEALDPTFTSPRRPRAVLTFDDGEVGLYDLLLPYAESNKIPATVYVATGQIEAGEPYWFDKIMNSLQNPDVIHIDLRDVGLQSWTIGPEPGVRKWMQISSLLETLKGVPEDRRRELTDLIISQVPPSQNGRSFKPLAPMSVSQLQDLASSKWITIGSHSHCHSLLDKISIADVEKSLIRSRQLLEQWTGQPVQHFAYPNNNYNENVKVVVKKLGYQSAVGDIGLCKSDSDLFALPRIMIGRYDSNARFRLRLLNI